MQFKEIPDGASGMTRSSAHCIAQIYILYIHIYILKSDPRELRNSQVKFMWCVVDGREMDGAGATNDLVNIGQSISRYFHYDRNQIRKYHQLPTWGLTTMTFVLTMGNSCFPRFIPSSMFGNH